MMQKRLALSASAVNPYDRYVPNFNVGIFFLFGKLKDNSIRRNKHRIESNDVEKSENNEDNLNQ
jgi:hypothetical protein